MQEPPRRSSHFPPEPRAFANGKKILVIDDDEAFGQMTRIRLEKLGFRVRFHRGPFGALHAIRENACDVVVLDVSMPGLDGAQLVRLMRSAPGLERTKIVLFSGMEPEALETVAAEIGAPAASKSGSFSHLVDLLEAATSPRAR